MASSHSKTKGKGEDHSKPLPNRRDEKMPRIPPGSRIQKRPLPGRLTSLPKRVTVSTRTTAEADPDGYKPPPRAPHTAVIYVGSRSPFMSIVKQARKALDKAPQAPGASTKGLPFAARVAALKVGGKDGKECPVPVDGMDDVVLVGTGNAIQKTVEIGAYFTRDKELFVIPRTRTVHAVDDVVMGEDVDEEDQTRVRALSCLEIGLRWKSGSS